MAEFAGLFDLKMPSNLLRKLEHDLHRMEADTVDAYAAFDFFVTAGHMLDWVHPGSNNKLLRERIRKESPLHRLCWHLANGAKHFIAEAKQHKSVSGTEHHLGAFTSGFSPGFDISRLWIHLEPDERDLFGNHADALDVARMVLNHWRNELEPTCPEGLEP